MAIFENGPVRIHYQVEGEGFPVLLLAPGGMRSANDFWNRMTWNPRTALRDRYRVIGMDQRNAGASSGPISGADNWATYEQDQLALLDHLAIDRCHVLGMCIGGPYAMGLLRTAPERFASAVLLQPVGIDGNNAVLLEMFHAWATDLAPHHPEVSAADWSAFGDNMYQGEFLLSVTRQEAAECETPILVFMGDDQYHPQSTSHDLVALAPHATLVEHWKDEALVDQTDATIKEFLAEHTPL